VEAVGRGDVAGCLDVGLAPTLGRHGQDCLQVRRKESIIDGDAAGSRERAVVGGTAGGMEAAGVRYGLSVCR
jgi:hypothetical protein